MLLFFLQFINEKKTEIANDNKNIDSD